MLKRMQNTKSSNVIVLFIISGWSKVPQEHEICQEAQQKDPQDRVVPDLCSSI